MPAPVLTRSCGHKRGYTPKKRGRCLPFFGIPFIFVHPNGIYNTFPMKNRSFFLLVSVLFVFPLWMRAQVGELPRSVPEAEGVPSRAIAELFDSLMALPHTDIHSVMVLRHGKVIAEMYPAPFAARYRHTMYSCSKTFVSAAVGLAIADNRLQLTDRVATLLPEYLPDTISGNLAAMNVRDLLTMTSGITPDWDMRSQTPDWIKTYLSKPVSGVGSKFQYDSISTYLLAAIVQKATGMTLLEYLQLKLFNPMHITEVAWELSPEGYNTGGWGLHIQPESLAKFGQLLLDGGKWQGRQLLPARWVKEMMTEQQPGTGYGYQMWQCEYPGAWRADGALGQYILIVPDKDMVVVITECTLINGINQRRLVWNRLLPSVADTALPLADRDNKRLQRKEAAYALPVVEGSAFRSNSLDGHRILLEENKYGWQSLTLHTDRARREVHMDVTTVRGEAYTLSFGYKTWLTATMEACPPYSIAPVDAFKGIGRSFHTAGSYAWATRDVLRLRVHYVDWISALTLDFRTEGRDVTLSVAENYAQGVVTIKGSLAE